MSALELDRDPGTPTGGERPMRRHTFSPMPSMMGSPAEAAGLLPIPETPIHTPAAPPAANNELLAQIGGLLAPISNSVNALHTKIGRDVLQVRGGWPCSSWTNNEVE